MMQANWKTTLINNGAEFGPANSQSDASEHLIGFGDAKQELKSTQNTNIISDLSHNGLLAVYGKDSIEFLQGQLTCDVTDIEHQKSRLGALCTHQGRMISAMRLFAHQGRLYLRLPADMLMTTGQRLAQFVIAADVNIDDASSALTGLGLSGPEASEKLEHAIGAAPKAVDAVIETDGLTIIRVPSHGKYTRFEIYGDVTPMQRLWMKLNAHCTPVGQACWELLEIQAAIPNIYAATSEAFVPQMTNLQQLGGINFKKGCYTGQEVVARMQFRGESKRRLYLAQINALNIQASSQLWQSGVRSAVGKIVDAAPHPDGGSAVLAVLQIAKAESARVHLGDENGPELKLLDLPYSLQSVTD